MIRERTTSMIYWEPAPIFISLVEGRRDALWGGISYEVCGPTVLEGRQNGFVRHHSNDHQITFLTLFIPREVSILGKQLS